MEKRVFLDSIKISIRKMNEIGWVPKVDVAEGFSRMIESFEEKKNEEN